MIIRNIARCLICGDTVESKTRHDFRWCSCGNLAVDGGKDYLKRCCKDKDKIEELSEIKEEDEAQENPRK